MFGTAQSRPSPPSDDVRLPRGECRFILLHPEVTGQRCSCQGFTLNKSVPGSSCECGHLACYHVPDQVDNGISREEHAALLSRVQALEHELERERRGRRETMYERIRGLEATVEKQRFEREEEVRGIYRAVTGVYYHMDRLHSQTTKRLHHYDEEIDGVVDRSSGFVDELEELRKRVSLMDERAMDVEDRLEELEDEADIRDHSSRLSSRPPPPRKRMKPDDEASTRRKENPDDSISRVAALGGPHLARQPSSLYTSHMSPPKQDEGTFAASPSSPEVDMKDPSPQPQSLASSLHPDLDMTEIVAPPPLSTPTPALLTTTTTTTTPSTPPPSVSSSAVPASKSPVHERSRHPPTPPSSTTPPQIRSTPTPSPKLAPHPSISPSTALQASTPPTINSQPALSLSLSLSPSLPPPLPSLRPTTIPSQALLSASPPPPSSPARPAPTTTNNSSAVSGKRNFDATAKPTDAPAEVLKRFKLYHSPSLTDSASSSGGGGVVVSDGLSAAAKVGVAGMVISGTVAHSSTPAPARASQPPKGEASVCGPAVEGGAGVRTGVA